MHFREGVVVQAVHLGPNTAIGEVFLPLPVVDTSLCLSIRRERGGVGLQEMRPKESIVTVSLSLSLCSSLSKGGRKLHNTINAIVQLLSERSTHVM